MTGPVVTVERAGLTATVRLPDRRADLVLRRAVPPTGREAVDIYTWTVWTSRVGALVEQLHRAGYTVDEVGR